MHTHPEGVGCTEGAYTSVCGQGVIPGPGGTSGGGGFGAWVLSRQRRMWALRLNNGGLVPGALKLRLRPGDRASSIYYTLLLSRQQPRCVRLIQPVHKESLSRSMQDRVKAQVYWPQVSWRVCRGAACAVQQP